MSTLFNAVNGFLFFRTPVPRVFYLALALGLPGMALIFWQDLVAVEATWRLLGAVGLSLLGTYGFSLGNMVSVRHQRRGLEINTTNAFAMLYGALFLGFIAVVQGTSFSLPTEPRYLGALVYLAVIGSIGGLVPTLCWLAVSGLVKRLMQQCCFHWWRWCCRRYMKVTNGMPMPLLAGNDCERQPADV